MLINAYIYWFRSCNNSNYCKIVFSTSTAQLTTHHFQLNVYHLAHQHCLDCERLASHQNQLFTSLWKWRTASRPHLTIHQTSPCTSKASSENILPLICFCLLVSCQYETAKKTRSANSSKPKLTK